MSGCIILLLEVLLTITCDIFTLIVAYFRSNSYLFDLQAKKDGEVRVRTAMNNKKKGKNTKKGKKGYYYVATARLLAFGKTL